MNLKQLLTIAPVSEDFKKEVWDKYDTLTPDQIYELTDLCWSVITEAKKMEMIYAREKYMTDIAMKKRKYDPKDLDEIQAKVDYEWSQKIRQSESQSLANDNQKQIDQLKTKPLSQDKVTSPPPVQKP